MSLLRVPWRLGLAIVYTLIGLLAVLTAGPRARLSGRSAVRLRATATRRWGRRMTRALAVDVEVVGERPPAPFFLVCNHLTYLDIFLVAGAIECAFVAKSEVGEWPLFGTVARAAGTLFVDRSLKRDIPRVLDEIRERMEQGVGIVLFPEGTSSEGETILPFKSSLLEVAARAEVPVYYATVSYATPPGAKSARDAVCWVGDMSLVPHLLGLARLERIQATIEFGSKGILEPDRKRLTAQLWEASMAQFRPVR